MIGKSRNIAGSGLVWLLPLTLAACHVPPDLPERRVTETGAPPQLLPISTILEQAAEASSISVATSPESTQARAAALRARAQGLRGQILPDSERERLLASEQSLR